jgi:hypothetical protein
MVDVEGGGAVAGGTYGRGVDAGLGVSGLAIPINSDTVTNLNPFASSWSSVAGIASIVPG